MNAALSRIAEGEDNPRFMPPPPAAFHDHGGGMCEEVPIVNADFLRRCGTESLYLVAEDLDIAERFTIETKEELVQAILAKTSAGEPPKTCIQRPLIPFRKLTGRQKRQNRRLKRQVRQVVSDARKLEGMQN